MQKSTKYILEEVKNYLNKGYVFCPDTNFFIECPEVLQFLTSNNEKILISKIVYDELDSGKSAPAYATKEEKEKAQKKRKGLAAMDDAKAIRIPEAPHSFLQSKQLGFSNDEKIIGSYFKHMEDTGENVVFLTLDRGAKMIARSIHLPHIDFDITYYFQLKNKYQSSRATSKSKGPISLIGKIIGRTILSIQLLIGFLVIGIIGLAVVLFILDQHKDIKEQERFNHIEGDQSIISAEVVNIDNEEDENTFKIEVDVFNQTSSEINLSGVKDNEIDYAVNVSYKDGTNEAHVLEYNLQPREKYTLYILSNGQTSDIEKIEIYYQKPNENVQVLTITPEEKASEE